MGAIFILAEPSSLYAVCDLLVKQQLGQLHVVRTGNRHEGILLPLQVPHLLQFICTTSTPEDRLNSCCCCSVKKINKSPIHLLNVTKRNCLTDIHPGWRDNSALLPLFQVERQPHGDVNRKSGVERTQVALSATESSAVTFPAFPAFPTHSHKKQEFQSRHAAATATERSPSQLSVSLCTTQTQKLFLTPIR